MDTTKALELYDKAAADGVIMYARRGEIRDTTDQYEPLVTVIDFDPDDFVSFGGNNYPEKRAQEAIADAAGVSFIPEKTKLWEEGTFQELIDSLYLFEGVWQVKGKYSVKSSAVAIRRRPDGTMKEYSAPVYEFNVSDRYNDARLGETGSARPKNILEARKKLGSIKKFATRLAATGGSLAAIREAAGIPTSFKRKDLGKPICFSQTCESQKYKNKLIAMAMETPEGREQVLNKVLGITESIYGKKGSQSNPKPAELTVDTPKEGLQQSDDSIPGFEEPVIDNESIQAEQRDLRQSLNEWEESGLVVYLNDKVGTLGDPNKENLAKIRVVLEQNPIDVGRANLLLDGLSKIYNRK